MCIWKMIAISESHLKKWNVAALLWTDSRSQYLPDEHLYDVEMATIEKKIKLEVLKLHSSRVFFL